MIYKNNILYTIESPIFIFILKRQSIAMQTYQFPSFHSSFEADEKQRNNKLDVHQVAAGNHK